MSKTAATLAEVRARVPANDVCKTMQECTLRILAARIFGGAYF